MRAPRTRGTSTWLAVAIAALLLGGSLVGLLELGRAVSSAASATPPALIGWLADDYAAPLLRVLGTADPAPAAVAALIRYTLLAFLGLGALLAAAAARSLATARSPGSHG